MHGIAAENRQRRQSIRRIKHYPAGIQSAAAGSFQTEIVAAIGRQPKVGRGIIRQDASGRNVDAGKTAIRADLQRIVGIQRIIVAVPGDRDGASLHGIAAKRRGCRKSVSGPKRNPSGIGIVPASRLNAEKITGIGT